MIILAVSISAFFSVFLLTLGAGPYVSSFWNEVQRAYRVEALSSSAPQLLQVIYPLLKVLARYNRRLPLTDHKAKLQKRLRQAGAAIEIAPDEFIGICQLSAFASLAFAVLLLKAVLGMSLFVCFLVAVGGYFLPVLWLNSYVEDRLIGIHRQLPYVVDLLVMAMEAGSTFLEALSIYIQDNRNETLAEEFSLFVSEINLGTTRKEALTNLSDRIGSEEIKSFALAIIQGEEMGTPLGVLLRIYADGMRLKRTQRAEKIAGEAAVKILGPTMTIMVAIVLLVLGPVLIKYIRGELGF